MILARVASAFVFVIVAAPVIDASTEGVGPVTQAAPAPSSSGYAALDNGALQAGAGGVYEPISPDNLAPAEADRANPMLIAPSGPNPQGEVCPSLSTVTIRVVGNQGGRGLPPGSIAKTFNIYPYFTKNKSGGYDGRDPAFGYNVRNAIPAGGDPSNVSIDAPATAANMAGHVIAVPAYVETYGTWQDAQPTPPYGGSCQGASFGFGAPYIAGDNPPPAPPSRVLNAPPFALGPSLLAEVTGSWRVGNVGTLPGPSSTARTYVHIPTCTWLNSSAPTTAVSMHAIKTALSGGFTLFLVYVLRVTPGTVTWDWGDGTTSTSLGAPESPPPSVPSYDPTAQTWTDPCNVSHEYASVSDGRTITATQTFSVTITVTWSDGVSVLSQSVPCDQATGGPCTLAIGPQQGWTSGPHPVSQIEPVPYSP